MNRVTHVLKPNALLSLYVSLLLITYFKYLFGWKNILKTFFSLWTPIPSLATYTDIFHAEFRRWNIRLSWKENFAILSLSTNIQMFVNTDSQRGAEFVRSIKGNVESRKSRRWRDKRMKTDVKDDRYKDMQELSSKKLCPSLNK